MPEIERVAAEDTVRNWFTARRTGDGTGLCLTETERFRKGPCDEARPRPATPAGDDLVFDSIERAPGGGLDVRVHARDVTAAVHLTGAGALLRVDRVTGL